MYGCFSPRKIKNQYTGVETIVPCRKCYYCRNKRSFELQMKVDREFLNPENKYTILITLDYDNEHLPTYTLNKRVIPRINPQTKEPYKYAEELVFVSNRAGVKKGNVTAEQMAERYAPIKASDVDKFFHPVNMPKDQACFGHLCFPDVQAFFMDVRSTVESDFKYNTPDYRELQGNYDKKDFKFSYFVCGEYGPTTLRPHYHAVLWFKSDLDEKGRAYIHKKLSKVWKNGSCDIKPITVGKASSYVSAYVNSTNHLPEVLQSRHVKPFSSCSSRNAVGAYKIDDEEISRILDTGASDRVKYDDRKQLFVLEVLSQSFYRRYFPKCRGFSYKDTAYKLSVYQYVLSYFQFRNIRHTREEVDNLTISDIEFRDDYFTESDDRSYNGWDYTDKYASLVCYKYCVKFDLSPLEVLERFERIYSLILLNGLKREYENEEQTVLQKKVIGNIIMVNLFNTNYLVNKDPFFLDTLPVFLTLLEKWQCDVLTSYDIDVDYLYRDGVLDFEYLDAIKLKNDPQYVEHLQKHSDRHEKRVKRKKMNDYKRNLDRSGKLINNMYYSNKEFNLCLRYSVSTSRTQI